MEFTKRTVLSLCSLLLFFPLHFFAQISSPVFRNYSKENGLPSSEVYQIKQDKRGYIWFATDNGVSRFDGNSFENFTQSEGLCVKTLFGIYEDEQDRIWFYSFSRELIYYDYSDEKMHCFSANHKLIKEVKSTTLLNGLFIIKDTLFAFNYKGDVIKVEMGNDTNAQFIEQASNINFTSFPENNFVHGSNNQAEKNEFVYSDLRQGKGKGFSEQLLMMTKDNPITSAVQSNDSVSFMTAESKLIRIDQHENQIHSIELDYSPTKSLYLDQNNQLWAGGFKKGVFAYDVKNNFIKTHHFLEGESVSNILQDKDGGFWFSTLGNGVYYTPTLYIKEIDFDLPELRNQRITSISGNAERVVFTANTNLLYSLNTSSWEKSIFYLPPKNDRVNGKIQLIGDTLWFGASENYIFKLPEFGIIKQIAGLRNWSKVKDRLVYLFFYKNKFEVKEGNIKAPEILYDHIIKDISRIRFTTLTRSKSFYFSTGSDLFYVDSSTSVEVKFKPITMNKEKPIVSSIVLHSGDSVWLGTNNLGVFLLHKDQILLRFDHSNGLPNNNFNHIYFDKPYLYLSSNVGIIRITPFGDSLNLKQINLENGLTSNEVFECLRVKNNIYVATNKGLSAIDTMMFNRELSLTKCNIDYKKSLGEMMESTNGKYEIPHDYKGFSIYFKALSFENAFKIPYRYRLNKLDEWVHINTVSVSLPNLTPHDYIFEVQAANANNQWGPSAFLQFTVLPPLWQKPWFVGLLILLSFCLIYLIYLNRLRNVKKINALKTSLVYEQNHAVSAQMNPHFIFNSLNSISNFILANDTKKVILYLGKFGKLMRMIFENSQENFITLSEELAALGAYLEIEKLRLKDKLNYQLIIDKNIDEEEVYLPALLLQPFVENAIWHGIIKKESQGMIHIEIKRELMNLCISIEDNGEGIDREISKSDKLNKSGIGTTLKRIELIKKLYKRDINYSIKPIKEKGKSVGTIVLLTIPLIETKPN